MSLLFPGFFKSLEEISQYVCQAAEQAGLGPDSVYAVQLAVDEACANIIEHAYGAEGRGEIECSCSTEDHSFKIVLHDWGKPFNPNNVPDPDPSTRLEDCKLGGAGLYLMRKMMDEVRYDIAPDGGNLCTMVKRLK